MLRDQGTGGFLLSAYDQMKAQPAARDRAVQRRLREKSLSGVDIVDEVVRLCGMNLYLHGIGNGESPIRSGDALPSIRASATRWCSPTRPSARRAATG